MFYAPNSCYRRNKSTSNDLLKRLYVPRYLNLTDFKLPFYEHRQRRDVICPDIVHSYIHENLNNCLTQWGHIHMRP